MNQPSERRRAAAEAFQQSLDQLQETLQTSEAEPTLLHSGAHSGTTLPIQSQASAKPSRSKPITLQELEEAVADIEQYMQARFSQGESVEG